MFDSKDLSKDLLRKFIASLIMYLIVGLILPLFPNIVPNTANFLACLIAALSIWAIYFFRRRKDMLSILPPIIINIIFILVFVLNINPYQPSTPTATATPMINKPTLVPTVVSTHVEAPTSSSTAKPIITSSKTTLPTLTLRPNTLITETSAPTLQKLTFTPPSPGSVFNFDSTNYVPNMYMGSTTDIGVELIDLSTMTYQFTVKACDSPPYQWDQLFIAKVRNQTPPHFSGILYTDGTYGQQPESGYNLSKYSQLKWEVRSLQGEVKLQFMIGGVKWTWNYETGEPVIAPYPDTTPPGKIVNAAIIANKTINNEWTPMSASLAKYDLTLIHGGFGWLLDYRSNNVSIPVPSTCSDNPATFKFEIRNVRYER